MLASKAFGIGGTARIEPFVGWSILFINARSGVIDATPGLRRVRARRADRRRTPSARPRRPAAGDDLNANFTFPEQDIITRQRFFGGFKLKLSVLFRGRPGRVRARGHAAATARRPSGAVDRSGTQQTYSLSAGFDF